MKTLGTIFVIFALILGSVGCSTAAEETALEEGGTDSGAQTEPVTSCDTVADCAAIFSSAECNPPEEDAEGAEGNSWNYEEILEDDFTDDDFLCLAGYASAEEFALGCLTYEGTILTAAAVEGDPCNIGSDDDEPVVCSTPSECSDDFTAFSLSDWNTNPSLSSCFNITANGAGQLTALATQAEGCDSGPFYSLGRATTFTNGSIQVTIDAWENLTESNTNNLLLTLRKRDGEPSVNFWFNLYAFDHPDPQMACSMNIGSEATLASTFSDPMNACDLGGSGEGPLTIRLEKTGNSVTASYDVDNAGFVALDETAEVPELGDTIDIMLQFRAFNSGDPMSVTLSNFLVDFSM